MSTTPSTPIACVLDAIPDDQRERYQWLVGQFQSAIQQVTELEYGFKFSLASQREVILNTAEWITWERLCCPFFLFTLEVENNAVSLSLTGDEGVKAFVESQLLVLLGTNAD